MMPTFLTSVRHTARTIAQSLGELVFPPACAGCGRTLSSEDGHWCEECGQGLFAAISKCYCPRCGSSVGEYMFDDKGCNDCREAGVRPAGMVRVGTYHDQVGQMLRRFKFNREHRLDACLGELLSSAIAGQPWHHAIDALVPVPTTWRGRLRYRSWPTWLLATQVSKHLDVPAYSLLYVKGKTRPQVGLPESSRAANVRGVFHVHPQARIDQTRLCIIDDVSTTGATLREVTRTLLKAGAVSVHAAVVAKTDRDREDS